MRTLIEKTLTNFYRPNWWVESASPYLQMRLTEYLSQVYHYFQEPTSLMEKDWDNVIILDGCRYDLFEEANTLDGELDYRISPVSATPEFLMKNFQNKHFYDTVYVTANPMYRTRGLEESFHSIIDVWDDEWNNELQTVEPEAMAKATLQAHNQYPNKRIISHFMQPHYPFIGDVGQKIGQHSGIEYTYRRVKNNQPVRDNPTVWERLRDEDNLPRELVWKAYLENVEIVIPHIRNIINNFRGKTVITSDHGNMLGERPFPLASRIYGHPTKIRCEGLCKVPWLVADTNERKSITEDEPRLKESEHTETVSERLSDLGYIDP